MRRRVWLLCHGHGGGFRALETLYGAHLVEVFPHLIEIVGIAVEHLVAVLLIAIEHVLPKGLE